MQSGGLARFRCHLIKLDCASVFNGEASLVVRTLVNSGFANKRGTIRTLDWEIISSSLDDDNALALQKKLTMYAEPSPLLSLEIDRAFGTKKEEVNALKLARRKGQVLGIVLLKNRDFDSRHFEKKVGSLEIFCSLGNRYSENRLIKNLLLKELTAQLETFDYLTCRVPAEDIAAANVLEHHGFEILSGMLSFQFNFRRNDFPKRETSRITPCRLNEVSSLATIAGQAFVYDRFHQDYKLTAKHCDSLHEKWVTNCCVNGLADVVLVSRQDGDPSGFIACRLAGELNKVRFGEIVLVSVASNLHGQGIGGSLIQAALEWFQKRTDIVFVRTESTNYSSVKMYLNAGFSLIESSNYFRR